MGHGLRHPTDLVAWRRWHESRHAIRFAVRATRTRIRPGGPELVEVHAPPGGDPQLLVAVEATHSTFVGAVVAPLAHLPTNSTAIAAPVGWTPPAGYASHRRTTVALDRLGDALSPRAVLAAGHYTAIGEAAFALAEDAGVPFLVSQHGALTPYAPPLPRAAHLLAWSEADADFWTAGRQDVQVTVAGSQLLWQAGVAKASDNAGGPLTYLGQGHAAEISRARLAHAALSTCRAHGALYRPHPSERDVTSRAVLRGFERAGVRVVTDGPPLVDLDTPIVSVFSTGVLEAAARGRDAWVDFPRPPAWLDEFWERYGMHRLGDSPTPAPARSVVEPARRVAEVVTEVAS